MPLPQGPPSGAQNILGRFEHRRDGLEVLQISPETAKRDWKMAKGLLAARTYRARDNFTA
jgi:hypothetical protein